MLILNLPKRNDPIARIALFVMLAAALWANVYQFQTAPDSALAQSPGFRIIDATPTPALPTPAELPALDLAVATPTPEPAPTAAPGWLDQGLAAVGNAGDQFAADQAAALAAEQAAADAKAAADRAQYLANVGAQASHSPRGDNPEPPPSYGTGPVAFPANDEQPAMIIDPNVPAPDAALAAAVPAISADQAAVIDQRESNGCAAGQIFYPRTGCHTPGSGGDMPGAVRP